MKMPMYILGQGNKRRRTWDCGRLASRMAALHAWSGEFFFKRRVKANTVAAITHAASTKRVGRIYQGVNPTDIKQAKTLGKLLH